ncbi:MerR family transcriptional regulator [Roseixanthobacter glucoisosaccharinicivorans]|uniref:MerR family transcriptional regulator n=1 Tax=Roseixanthobacter glucoisosaccharinicivorans TaxID=3119923 RepID=UPI00372A315C
MDANGFEIRENIAHTDRAFGAANVFTIGDLSREFGVTLRALRFYEDKGLLSPRREGLARLYSATDRDRLSVILKGKRLGFTLAEIRSLVAAHEGQSVQDLALTRDRCLTQLTQLERQRAEIEAAITELRETADRLAA